MKCPKDGTKMSDVEVDGIPLDVCPKCNGIWMDWGEIRRVSSDLVTEYELMYRGESDERCPKCGKKMDIADLHSAIVEKCKCGVFFDGGEADKVLGKELVFDTHPKIIISKDQLKELEGGSKITVGEIEIVVED